MVLEGILNPFKAEKHPIDGLFLGFLYASVAVLLALWIFEAYAGLVAVFLTVLATTPLIYGIINREEEKDIVQESEIMALKEHIPTLKFLLFLFIGVSLAIAAWYVFLPQSTASTTFSIQQQTISTINQATLLKPAEPAYCDKLVLIRLPMATPITEAFHVRMKAAPTP